MSNAYGPNDIDELPLATDTIPDQPCERLYESNPVLLGYDVVQYHFIPPYREGGVAVRGKPEHAYNFLGYQFWFSTAENRLLFVGDPWKYAPAWGGFCSWGIARELPPRWPWSVDFLGPPASPWEGWLIVNGTLIFNIWAGYSDRFLGERDGNMERAAERWAGWFGRLHAGPFNTHCIGHGKLQNWCMSRQPSPWLEDLPECLIVVPAGPPDPSGSGENITDSDDRPGGRDPPDADESADGPTVPDPPSSGVNCTEIALSGGVLPEGCAGIVVSGGGVVGGGGASRYSDFANSRYSPYQRRVIAIGASVGTFVLLAAVVFCCRKRIKGSCCESRDAGGGKEVGGASDSEDTGGAVGCDVAVAPEKSKNEDENGGFSSEESPNVAGAGGASPVKECKDEEAGEALEK